MASERVPCSPTKMADYLWLSARAWGPHELLDTAREYLESCSSDNVGRVQKVDADWAPFDCDQRPVPLSSTLDLQCIRDAIHTHCMALRNAHLAARTELAELDEYFFVSTEFVEHAGPATLATNDKERTMSSSAMATVPGSSSDFEVNGEYRSAARPALRFGEALVSRSMRKRVFDRRAS